MLSSLIKNDVLPLWKLSLPLVLTGLSQSMVFFFETLFLAHLGSNYLAAGALVGWLFGTLAVISFGTLGAINILVSNHYGAKKLQKISEIAKAGLLLALILAFFSFILFWNMPSIFLIFGQPPSIVLLAKHYLHALAFGLFPNFIVIALLELMLGLGHGQIILFFNISSVLLTISFSFLFIFGKLGLPALGIAGAGWGITTSYSIMMIILVIFVFLNSKYRYYFQPKGSFKDYLPSFSLIFDLFKIGMPIGVMYCLEVGFFFASSLMIGVLCGSEWLAANQVSLQYMCTLMSMIFSIAQAITVRMGHLLGAGDSLAAKRAALCGISTAASLMILAAVFFLFCPKLLISIDFDPNQAKVASLVIMSISLLKISALFQIIESIRIACFGALRSLKDTRFPLLSSLIGFWIIPIPIGLILIKYTSLSAAGLWWGMVCGASMSCFLLLHRLSNKVEKLP